MDTLQMPQDNAMHVWLSKREKESKVWEEKKKKFNKRMISREFKQSYNSTGNKPVKSLCKHR